MIEQLLSIQGKVVTPEGEPIFYLNPSTFQNTIPNAPSHSIAKSANVVTSSSVLIDNKNTIRIPTTGDASNSVLTVNFTSNFPMTAEGITIEWTSLPDNPMHTYWLNELCWSNGAALNDGLILRFADSGYNNRLTFYVNSGTAQYYATDVNKAAVVGKVNRWAMTVTPSAVRIYLNGSLVTFNTGTAGAVVSTIPVNNAAISVNVLRTLNLGYNGAALLGIAGNRGALMISKGVKYTGGSYTPVPF